MLKEEQKSIIEETKFIFFEDFKGNNKNKIDNEKDFAEAIDALDKLTFINEDYNFIKNLKKNMTSDDLKRFVDPEPFLKSFATDMNVPVTSSSGNTTTDPNNAGDIELAKMMKTFKLLPSCNWYEKDPITGKDLFDRPIQLILTDSFYSRMWKIREYRNQFTHNNQTPKSKIRINSETINIYRNAMIVMLLHLCYKYKHAISAKRSKQEINIVGYLEEIKNKYLNQAGEYTYLKVKWGNEREHGFIDEICNDQSNNKPILFYGGAGIGKTTTLKEIEYYFATHYETENVVPIYVELKKISFNDENQESYILNKVINDLGVSSLKAVYNLFESNKTALLLDGLNEINIKNQDAIKADTENICAKYKNCKVFVTNRTRKVIVYPQKDMTLDELSINDKKAFFDKNCKNEKTKNIITNELDNSELKFKNIKTPYFLKKYIDYVEEENKAPINMDDFIAFCVNDLKRRETGKGENETIIKWMDDSLSEVAKKIVRSEGIAESNDLKYDGQTDDGYIMSEKFYRQTISDYLVPIIKNSAYGSNENEIKDTVDHIFNLTIEMGIIQEDGNKYLFRKEYFNYFKKR